jgi:predicted amidophosphoribosyltransferase
MRSFLSAVIEALRDALAVFFPVFCAGCGEADRVVCGACQVQLVPEVTRRALTTAVPVYTSLIYESEVRRVLLALKEEGRTEIAHFLGPPMRAALDAALSAATAVGADALEATECELATVPTSAAAWRRRGFDPVWLLCRKAGYRPARVLVVTRRTRSQKTLGELERATNLAGSMQARGSLAGRRFVLVDDILTTGATLREAVRAIEDAGGRVLCAAAVTYTRRIIRHAATQKEVLSDIAS